VSVEYIRRPDGLGEPLGRYSHVAVGDGRLIAVAGQFGADSNGDGVPGDLTSQTHQVFKNLGHALAAAGASYGDVLRMNTYMVGAEHIPAFMAARTAVFAEIYPDGNYPPNTLVVVSRLVEPAFLVEVDALAFVKSGS
jgi:enamine deaminase RidA (YjgF/YER057c/UK114 family)